jgi:hypothetical protein
MKKITWVATNIIVVALLITTFIWAIPVKAAQYGTNFIYSNLGDMEGDGWTISNPAGVTLRSDGIVLDGSKGLTTITYANNIPSDVTDWQVGAKCAWLGGSGHSWLDVQVNTQSHTYVFALDGASAQYVLLRDNVKVIGVNGYQETANSQVEIDMAKAGSSISIVYNGQVIQTYTENNSSPVTSVAISSPPSSAALYTWAGANVPEPSSSGPTGTTTTEPASTTTEPTISTPIATTTTVPSTTGSNPDYNPNWANYFQDEMSVLNEESNAIPGTQDNPGSTIDYPTHDPDSPIPDPPLPPNDNNQTENQNTNSGLPTAGSAPQNSYQNIWIVVLDGTFSINTANPQVDGIAAAEEGQYLFDGVGQKPNVYIGDGSAAMTAAAQQEQAMFEAGMIAPETHTMDYIPWGGDTPSYYVTGSTHISGDVDNPLTQQSAVATFTYQVTDASGNVVYQNTITATASEGKTLAQYWKQASQDINTYLQGVINR